MDNAFKFGRPTPPVPPPTLHLRNYLMRKMPTPPAACDYSSAAQASLRNMYLNDQYGNCVIAGMGHVSGVLTGNAGIPSVLYADADIIRLYGAIGGYVPGDPSTDNGCMVTDALNYWKLKGMLADGSHKIDGWISVNPTDLVEIHLAIWLFENLVFGVELPDAWITPFPSADGFTWDVAGSPNPSNGHCFVAESYKPGAVGVATWALEGQITDAAVAKYCAASTAGGELYTVISADGINRATMKAPSGFDFSQLVADIDALAWPGVL
jgi:hypothetical protein